MRLRPRLLVAVCLFGVILAYFAYTNQSAGAPVGQYRIQQQVENLLKQVDSESFAGLVSTSEFVVNAFQLVQNRNPLPREEWGYSFFRS